MSEKEKFADSPENEVVDIPPGSPLSGSPCKSSPTVEGLTNGKATKNAANYDASDGKHAEQADSDSTSEGIPLSEININRMTISGKESEDCGNDQPEVPQRKVSKCFEAAEYFSGECGSLDSSSNNKAPDPLSNPNIVAEEIPGEDGEGFVELQYNVVIQEKDLVDLMIKIRSNHYTVSECPEEIIFSNCKVLFERDYELEILDNYGGNLSNHYPERLPIPTKRKGDNSSKRKFDNERYTELVRDSIGSRCRSRFVVPVILFRNKFICRSGTLSVRKGAFFDTALKAEVPQDMYVEDGLLQACSRKASNLTSSIVHRARSAGEAAMNLITSNSMERMRELDRQILKTLKLEFICDLMIEERKMYCQAISVSSSEKVNRYIYHEFKIEQMPYPGCEFFKMYHSSGREARGLVFNWDRPDCNTELEFSSDPGEYFSDIDWNNYKKWDVIDLTKNYLKVLLLRLIKGKGGLLVHCISGWDRTPLIISLLRISLWADGVIHQSLGVLEMAYLTLAYDWYLFGHNFPARMHHREEILHYCFDFLPSIATDEFSITKMFESLPFPERYNRSFPTFTPGRREVLNNLSSIILDIYNEVVTKHYGW